MATSPLTGCLCHLAFGCDPCEGAKFWLSVLNDLKLRGVQDILITVVDGLKGFLEALETVFPDTTVQTCIEHLLRYCLSSASYHERKDLAAALKPIYQAENADRAEVLLEEFKTQKYEDRTFQFISETNVRS